VFLTKVPLFTFKETFIEPQITNSMQQDPSSEADCSPAGQDSHCLLWNPKNDYCIHKNMPLDSVLSKMNPVHTPKH
jgi:hypothetical protein